MGVINGEREKAVGSRRTSLIALLGRQKAKSLSLLFPFHRISPFTVKEEIFYGISCSSVSFHCSYLFCLLGFELSPENRCWNQVREPNLYRQGLRVCCFGVRENAPKMEGINRGNRNKNAQKERIERRTARKPTSSDCWLLHTFSLRDMQARIIIGERTSKRCRVIEEKIPSDREIARYLFPAVPCGHFTPYRSHKHALR